MLSIQTPTLLLNEDICRANIRRMADKAVAQKVQFRPHFKTHQSLKVGVWFRDVGVSAITVSSLEMAAYFAADGWDDITVAFPVNIREMATINRLAEKISLNLLVVDPASIGILNQQLTAEVGYFIKIDSGYHRTGLEPHETTLIDSILTRAGPYLRFRGFLTHAGHTYGASSAAEALALHRESRHRMQPLRRRYVKEYPQLIISVGDTPGCSLAADFADIDEIRPGNFVFYDVMQYQLGSCKLSDIAVALAVPVVALHPQRHQIVVYGGGVHLSKEWIPATDGLRNYGLVCRLDARGWSSALDGTLVCSLSQEHGCITASLQVISSLHVGDLVAVLPIHSCMTAQCMGGYTTLRGKVIDHG